MDQLKAILEIVINYFLEIFKYWGLISQEDIDKVTDLLPEEEA